MKTKPRENFIDETLYQQKIPELRYTNEYKMFTCERNEKN